MPAPRRRADSAQIQADHDARIEDYVNDKLQTHADLEGLDVLLENVRIQQDLLKKQLDGADRDSRTATETANKHSQDHAGQTRVWEQRRKDIDRRIQTITQSSTSDEAVHKFEPILQKLQHLDLAAGVVDLLLEIDRLSAQARQNFKSSPREALEPYLRIRQIATALKQAQPLAEDAAPHLVDSADATANLLWRQMKEAYAADFEQTLKKMKWPGKELTMEGGLAQEWADGVQRLLELQEPELKTAEEARSQTSVVTPISLLPLEVMARPLELGFKYHFEGDKPTNRLDKPEYFLSHVANLLNTYEEFFVVYLQPIIAQRFRDTVLSLNPLYVDCTSAWITALLPMLRQKLAAFLPRVSTQPQLLSHLIHELMSFDASLRDDWSYTGGSVAEDWRGLTWEVLVKEGWFPKWLQAEKDFALERYESIIAPADSGEIDFDSVDPGITKPTKAAIRVNDLLETITDRYRHLSSFSQKLHFLIDIQIAIFDQYHRRLHDALEAYLTMTSSLARTVQGVSEKEQAQLRGLSGLDRLCRLYGSAEYLEKKMQDWSEDVFFVELWDELQYRAKHRDAGHLGGDLTVAHVAWRTSNTINDDDDETGGLFDETSTAYRRLRIRTESVLTDTLSQTVRDALRPYGRSSAWSSVSDPTPATPALAMSAELDAALEVLNTSLAFLARVLSDTALRRVARAVALTVQTYVWDSVLMRHHFSDAGVRQLARDVAALEAAFDTHVAPGQGRAGMARLGDAIGLLGLPTDGAAGDGEAGGEGEDGEDGEDAWGLDDGDAAAEAAPTGERGPTLQEVEARVYRDNAGARAVLEELGLGALSEGDARNVLGRRVQAGG